MADDKAGNLRGDLAFENARVSAWNCVVELRNLTLRLPKWVNSRFF